MQRIATIMAETSMVPDSLRQQDGENLPPHRVIANCFMVVNQAVRWGMDPFAVAQCASLVHGKLMWEGKMVAAVLDSVLGIRLQYEFDNKPDQELGVTVSGQFSDEDEPRTITGRVKDWHRGPKSPWANPGAWKRQLRYMGAREWARAHAPSTMLGVMADDEMIDTPRYTNGRRYRDVTPSKAQIASALPDIPDEIDQTQPVNMHDDDAASALVREIERKLDGCTVLGAIAIQREYAAQIARLDMANQLRIAEMIDASRGT